MLYATDKYGIGYLQSICEFELAAKLSLETALHIAPAAYHCGSETFKNYVFGFVRKHWKKLKDSEEADLIRKSPSVLSQIVHKISKDQ